MAARIGFIAFTLLLCLAKPSAARAQALATVSAEEYQLLTKLLEEPDGQPAYAKRLRLIGDALERMGDPKRSLSGGYAIGLGRARIPPADGVPFALPFLDRDAEATVRAAMGLLGEYGSEAKAAVPRLRQLMDHAARGVREDAMLTLA